MSVQIAPQAALQRRILFALAAGPSPSVVTLAAMIDSTRPSVSRSLKALAELGLVESHRRSWSVTTLGRAEIERLRSPYTPSLQRVLARQVAVDHQAGLTLTRMSRMLGAANMIGALGHTSAIGDAAKQFAALRNADKLGPNLIVGMDKLGAANMIGALGHTSAIGDAAKQLAALRNADKLGPNLIAGMDKLGGARADVLNSLQVQMSALSVRPSWWSSMVADNMSFSARIASDVASMTAALAVPSHLGQVQADSLQRAVGRVVATHRGLLDASIARILAGPAFPEAPTMIISPTAATAAFTGTARDMLLPIAPRVDSADLLREAVREVAAQLEAVGAPASARDLRAAWDVLKRRRLGWPKAGSHLIRETIREALDELASPDLVPRDEAGVVTKRRQVLWIVGDNAALAVWVETIATSVGKLHSVLSAEAKNTNEPRIGWQGLLGLLETTTGILRILADHAGRRPRT